MAPPARRTVFGWTSPVVSQRQLGKPLPNPRLLCRGCLEKNKNPPCDADQTWLVLDPGETSLSVQTGLDLDRKERANVACCKSRRSVCAAASRLGEPLPILAGKFQPGNLNSPPSPCLDRTGKSAVTITSAATAHPRNGTLFDRGYYESLARVTRRRAA